jgi:4'-phosphopantetheinyl transferase
VRLAGLHPLSSSPCSLWSACVPPLRPRRAGRLPRTRRAALAVAGYPVGVDVQRYHSVDTELLAPAVLAPGEQAYLDRLRDPFARDRAFHRCWTRKEAVLKAAGIGTAANLSELDTHPGNDGTSGPVPVRGDAPGALAALTLAM